MKCFFHSSDADGWCSGAIIKQMYPNCEMIGINYGQEFPWDSIHENETVFMVDFSLQPFDDMFKLNETCVFIWIDHHKSAIEEAERNCFTAGYGQKLEIGKGACELVWEYFYNSPVPKSIKLLSLYDVWKLEEGTLELQNGIRLYDTHPNNQVFWEELFNTNNFFLDELLEKGKILLQKQTMDNEHYAKACAFEVNIYGFNVIAINRGLTSSKLFESVYDPNIHDIMCAFVFRGTSWTISLYTDKKHIDVSKICRKLSNNYGDNGKGGGHKQAAGCQVYKLPFKIGE